MIQNCLSQKPVPSLLASLHKDLQEDDTLSNKFGNKMPMMHLANCQDKWILAFHRLKTDHKVKHIIR